MTDSVKITTSNTHSNMNSGEIVLAHSNEIKLIPKMNECDCNMNMSNSVENTQTNNMDSGDLLLASNTQLTMNIHKLTLEEINLMNRIRGRFNFHTWCIDKTTGEVVDDYLNENTSIGKAFKTRIKACKVTRVTHKPFNKLPKFCKNLKKGYDKIVQNKTHYKTMKVDNISYDNYGCCFQRAYRNYLNNPDTYKIIMGQCYYHLECGKVVESLPSSKILGYCLTAYKLNFIKKEILNIFFHWCGAPNDVINIINTNSADKVYAQLYDTVK